MHPLANLDEVEFDDIEDNGLYTSRRACFSASIGARQLGYNLTLLPPGKAQCPFHNHHGEEEMFLILEGTGELRFGQQRLPLRPMDVVACPTGGPEVAHQIINTGSVPMRYLAVSNRVPLELCEYPDSGKLLVASDGPQGERRLRKVMRAELTVDYYDRKRTDAPGGTP
ncbi:cupin domain-containing protein [Ideonella sp. 4Y16]|uniref:cupin domain-containing protein n=1 Tax=Ideonella alba TaxID=2824118 RepID=UPI001B37068B|nr:cupin domain-containing protein [Ideonella alba]MBQ0942006.1 cupin domain-containing protein [Ideonella alba]